MVILIIENEKNNGYKHLLVRQNVYKLNYTIQADHSIPFWPKSDRYRWYWV